MKASLGRRQRLIALALVAATRTATAAEPPADLLLTHGHVWTADAATPWAEAVAIRGGSIVYVGAAAGAAPFTGKTTQVVDLGGRLALPGFNDSHLHLVSGALSLERVDLSDDPDVASIQAHIRAFAAANPDRPWVLGRGWLYGAFPGGMPTRAQLDAAVPDRPAYMECYDGHTAWVNSKALALAGITKDTPDPEKGRIVRDPATGEPTGALKEDAASPLEAKIPLPDAEATYRLMLRAFALLNSDGITSVQDAGYPVAEMGDALALFERAAKEDKLTLRIKASVQMDATDYAAAVAEAVRLKAIKRDPRVRLGTIKGYVDGVVESRTAAMLEPYADDPSGGRGLPNWEPATLDKAVAAADHAGLQIYLHAIGDRGVRMALDAYQAARRQNGQRDRRGRIEHIETIASADYPRFKTLGVIASMQPLHANPDQNNSDVWIKNIGTDRASRAFSWGNLQRAGARLTFGSDWPVVTPDVLRGLYCAVTRKTKDGTPAGGWLPEQSVGLEDALRHYTIDAAYASFEEQEKGSLEVGKKGDVVVLSDDLFKTPPETILKTKVMLTVMDGKLVYRSGL